MYTPKPFREDRQEVLQAFIARHPLGALVCVTDTGLTANHIPMQWSPRDSTPGALRGHVARANAIWQRLAPDADVLVIFSGGNRYISPSWYPGKAEHGKVVPTWNYAVVHAHGTIQFEPESQTEAHRNVTDLTNHLEIGRPNQWQVADAPAEYVDSLVRQIVPFQISIRCLTGKFKASQHRDESERRSVAIGLAGEGASAQEIDEVVAK